jgi:rhamnose utilization protein RhaD (predicted bifunctional aldolase and dehydrogenase)/NAD(P)-dependent dehydrogenase (short-subunit alcohol dehydrogenase family)
MESRWNDKTAGERDGRELLAYVSNLIGCETELVLHGGGNTSWKAEGEDHLGRAVRLLHVKPSGTDLDEIRPEEFAALRLADLEPLETWAELDDGLMEECIWHATADSEAFPSIESLLHAFLPDTWVLHSHADALLGLCNRSDGENRVRDALGDRVAIVGYRRPGFLLAKEVAAARRETPGATAIVLMKHGLVTFGDTAKEAYERHIECVTLCEEAAPLRPFAETPPEDRKRACEIAAALRGALCSPRIMLFLDDDFTRAFLADEGLLAATQRGPATADHIIRTGCVPEIVREIPERFEGKPRILLVPGVGMWAVGDTREEAAVAREIYRHTLRTIRRAEGDWAPIAGEDLRHADEWPLQRRKLEEQAEEGELTGRIAWISGAASGLGRDIALRFWEEGAHLVLTDVDEDGLGEIAHRIGTRAVAVPCDVSDEAQVEESFRKAVMEFGGVDIVVSNAGIARPAAIEDLTLEEWERSMAVNATGHFLVSRAAMRILRDQGMGGSIVFNASKNVLSPGKGFAAYSASKAAESQLAKVLALEAAEIGVRVNLLHPDAIFRGTRLWSEELKEERAKAHDVPVEMLEVFYAQRNLLKVPVRGSDVAEAALFFASERSSRTTGCCLTIDGGIKDAFPR